MKSFTEELQTRAKDFHDYLADDKTRRVITTGMDTHKNLARLPSSNIW
jgi:hypothetical protein